MKLSDNDIRDITRSLEQGKPLDEKYRFIGDGVVAVTPLPPCR